MLSLLLSWLAATSVMPLTVGAAIGAVGQRVLRPCRGGMARHAAWAAAASLTLHLALVASGLAREGTMIDYGSVLASAIAASVLTCLLS